MVAEAESTNPVEESLREEAAVWRLLHNLFRPPTKEQWEWLNLPAVRSACAILSERCGASPPDVPIPEDLESYHEGFLSTFDVGMPNPPCPLLESHWNKRESPGLVRERNMRFFEQFGLRLRSADGSPPDHLRHQLELLEYLCRLELERRLAESADEAEQISRGREEFIRLHLLSWIPSASRELGQQQAETWPARWLMLVAACLEQATSSGQGEAEADPGQPTA